MNLRYILHHVIELNEDGDPLYRFAGVIVHGPNFERDLDYAYLPGFGEEEDFAADAVWAVVESGKPVPADILEQLASTRTSPAGTPWQFSEVIETSEYAGFEALEAAVLEKMGPKTA